MKKWFNCPTWIDHPGHIFVKPKSLFLVWSESVIDDSCTTSCCMHTKQKRFNKNTQIGFIFCLLRMTPLGLLIFWQRKKKKNNIHLTSLDLNHGPFDLFQSFTHCSIMTSGYLSCKIYIEAFKYIMIAHKPANPTNQSISVFS